jgi:hypothetical protein
LTSTLDGYKIKIIVFRGREPVRAKVVLDNKIQNTMQAM